MQKTIKGAREHSRTTAERTTIGKNSRKKEAALTAQDLATEIARKAAQLDGNALQDLYNEVSKHHVDLEPHTIQHEGDGLFRTP